MNPSSPSRRRQVILTPRDVEIFRWLWLLRLLTLGQIRRLGYYQPDTGRCSVLDNVRKRMRRLWDAGYLSGTRLIESKERIYTLAPSALEPLRESYDLDQQRLYQPKLEAEAQLLHPLMVSECATRLVESLRGTTFALSSLRPVELPFVLTHTIGDANKRKHVERFLSQENLEVSGRDPFRIRPDLVFGVEKAGRGRLYFLEADRGTESVQDVVEKQLGYHAYLSALDPEDPTRCLWQSYGEFRDFRVLVVTSTQRRRQSLINALKGQQGWELTAVTMISEFESRHPLFDPIWSNQQGDGRALVKG